MAETVTGPVKFELHGKVLSTQTTARNWYVTSRRARFAFALLLLAGSISFCAAAQTPRTDVATGPDSAATQELFPIALRSAGETSESNIIVNRGAAVERSADIRKIIVIGFVGGFARPDDQGHPEVQFAEYLRDLYRPDMHAEVFGNHDGKKALHEVLRLLDRDGNGNPSSTEREHAKIIIYGHSWGATETVVFARELAKEGPRRFEDPFKRGQCYKFLSVAGSASGTDRDSRSEPGSDVDHRKSPHDLCGTSN
jgi:hypothetical protein